jgi:hypothetical protein
MTEGIKSTRSSIEEFDSSSSGAMSGAWIRRYKQIVGYTAATKMLSSILG